MVCDINQLKPLSATVVLYLLRAFADLRHHHDAVDRNVGSVGGIVNFKR